MAARRARRGAGSAVRFYRADTVADLNNEGIGGVPAFVFDQRLLVSGAQPHEVMEKALEQVALMREEEAAAAEA